LKTGWSRRTLQVLVIGIGLVGAFPRIVAAGEEDDLQRQIDTQKGSVADLERLDELKGVTDEIARLKTWLDEAWNLRAKHEYDQVREVLDRSLKQEDLIRTEIAVSKLRAQVQKREAALQEVRTKIARTRKMLQETVAKKKALEGIAQ
jgi:predicted  nucleic acid-binding Zn-ribbon protein